MWWFRPQKFNSESEALQYHLFWLVVCVIKQFHNYSQWIYYSAGTCEDKTLNIKIDFEKMLHDVTMHVSWASSVQFSHWVVSNSATPWTTAHQASLSISNSQSPPKPMSTESVMPSNHLILCCPLLFLPSTIQHQGLFQWVSCSHQVAKVLEFQLQPQSFQCTPRTDLL